MSVSPRRGAISEKITFFRSDSVWDIFLMNFGWFWEPFGHHFGTKVASKKRSENRIDLRWILERFLLPDGIKLEPILAPKIDQKSRSIFEGKRERMKDSKSWGRRQRRDSGVTFLWRKD